MTKQELVDAVQGEAAANSIELTKKDTATLIDAIFSIAAKEVSVQGRFTYPGFGTFSKKHRKAREGRNPQTGKPIQISASNTVGFKPAPGLKNRVN